MPTNAFHVPPSWALLTLLCLAIPFTSGCEQIANLIDSISDGAECSSNGSCLGGVCLTEFPGGYCSSDACPTEGCSNIFGSECLVLPNGTTPLCYESCGDSTQCREGYECFAVETANVCLPASFASDLVSAGSVGAACSNGGECDSGECLTNLVGGYCSVLNCTDDSVCDGGRCLTIEDEDAGTSLDACFASCSNDDGCRFGYQCVDPDGSGGVCLAEDPGASTPVRNPSGANDGEPCTVDINCKGGTCLRTEEGYPGGYCTTLDCSAVGCNAPAQGAECRTVTQETACFVDCNSAADCRAEYECFGAGTGDGYCAPPIDFTAPDPTTSGEITIECDGGGGDVREIAFSIAADTASFAVVPFAESGTVRPRRLRLPDGSVGADFNGDHKFLDVNPFYIQTAAPVFFPAAPQFESITQQGGGTYVLEVEASGGELCWYVLEKAAPGSRIAVNIYFVGIDGLTAASAGNHSGFNRMIDVFERIYGNAGITMDSLRLFDASAATAERYSIIRELNDIFRLATEGQDPGPTLEERLSIDVFLINGFSVPQAPGLLGVSLGIPGVPGLHGTSGSALVFTAEYLDGNADQVGQTMAHEIGHFNGLRHTTEHGGTEWDPIADTQECSNPDRGNLCPDSGNLMFPFSLGSNQETVSADQGAVLRASPHTR